ncbi:MAG TPA: metalloregulator ArsR/SmtB family transcription factor [Acidimicrobiia bacterium]
MGRSPAHRFSPGGPRQAGTRAVAPAVDRDPLDAALRAIAEPHRREIIGLIRNEELTAGQIAAHFTVSRGAISQHLRYLKDAGLVWDRRQGTRHLYRTRLESLAALRSLVELIVGDDHAAPERDQAAG